MSVEIRPIENHDEYRAIEQLQREIWGAADVEIIPHDLLLTAHKNGGVLLGAFDTASVAGKDRPIGFVFGFVGLRPDGRLKHCSHIAGVVSAYRDRDVGYALKLAQRQRVLAQGIDLITWTFDPLESRNAYFNFHKLGATCHTYLRNLYGEMRDHLNAGLPTDRLQVDWPIASPRVEARLRGEVSALTPSVLRAEGVSLLNAPPSGDPLRPPGQVLPLEGDLVLAQVPADFQALKANDLGLARVWRQHTRALFEAAFAQGYVVTDLLVEKGQSYYLLARCPSEDLTG